MQLMRRYHPNIKLSEKELLRRCPEKEGCCFRNSKFLYAFDIDDSHIHFSVPYILELLDDAKNKIFILYSHRPFKNLTYNYPTRIETL